MPRCPVLVTLALLSVAGLPSCSSSSPRETSSPTPIAATPAPSASDSTNSAGPVAGPGRGPGPGGTDASQPPLATTTAAGPAPSASASAGPAAAPAPTLEVKSTCPDTIHVSIGPNTSQLTDVAIPGRSSVNVKRDADGSQTLWIVTAKKAPPTPTRATAATKRLVIDIDCRSVRAD